MDFPNGDDPDQHALAVEESIRAMLSPTEPLIMRIQSLLVWENPRRSAVMFICVHAMFWYYTFTSCHFYSTVSTAAIIFFFMYTWKKRIWPEIRVPPPVPDDVDGWTPVHPRLLSVPELCHHLANVWCYLETRVKSVFVFRKRRPLAFCLVSSIFCLILAYLGTFISDILLSYIIVISILLWPCVLYHNLLQRCYMKFEPVFMKLDYSIKIKSKWSYRTAGSAGLTVAQSGDDGEMTSSVVADNESDLEEDFYPSTDPMVTAALARAITDSEDEGGTGGNSSPSLTPHLSKQPSMSSMTNSEDERVKDVYTDEDFTPNVDMMPSFEDSLEHTDDEMLGDFSLNSKQREGSQEPIKFHPSHFEDSSSSEEETVRQELTAADIAESLVQTALAQGQARSKGQTEPSESFSTALAKNLVAKTLTSVVGSALQTMTANLNENASPSSSSQHDRVAYTRSDSDDDEITMGIPDSPQTLKQRTWSEDSGDIDIEDEFEFLDQYEIDADREKQ